MRIRADLVIPFMQFGLPTSETGNAWKTGIVFVITGIFIGLLLTTQFKSSIPSTTYIYDELQAQKDLVESFVSDQSVLKARIVTLREEIDAAQNKTGTSGEGSILETLHSLKADVGLETARGQGVEIQLNDGLLMDRESADKMAESLIQASDLRDLVNTLRASQVTAIAINDQRIIASTSITSVGNTILVNNFHLLPPFTISAIGDPELISQRLNDPQSLPDLMRRVSEGKIQYQAAIKDGLTAPVYNGNLILKYVRELTPAS